MFRGFALGHQEIGAKSISIESKIRKKLLRATSRNNRCSNIGDRKHPINSLTQFIKKTQQGKKAQPWRHVKS